MLCAHKYVFGIIDDVQEGLRIIHEVHSSHDPFAVPISMTMTLLGDAVASDRVQSLRALSVSCAIILNY